MHRHHDFVEKFSYLLPNHGGFHAVIVSSPCGGIASTASSDDDKIIRIGRICGVLILDL